MKIYFRKRQGLRRAFYFYPLQLLMMTFKENLAFIFIWIIFFGFVTRTLATKYGAPYLFLYPEYLNHVGIRSYFILGFSCGGFMVAYNISLYIINSFRFPFLATLNRPFFIFAINNFIIPLAFLVTYIISIIHFRTYDGAPPLLILLHLTGFLTGVASFISITIVYFYFFEKGAFRVIGIGPSRVSKVQHKKEKIQLGYGMEWRGVDKTDPISYADRMWHVETYFGTGLKLRLARGYEHYDNKMLERIFRQNHQTGAVFEIVAIITLLLLGLFRDNPIFMLPAGASTFLLFAIFIMLLSAIHTWFRGWTTVFSLSLLLLINYISEYHFSFLSGKAFGINYKCAPAPYSYNYFSRVMHDSAPLRSDKGNMITILEKWKKKASTTPAGGITDTTVKPPIVLINTSGGGLRSAMWTFYSLKFIDSCIHGSLIKHTELITGSSGGIIGAAYFRELYLEKEEGKVTNLYDDKYVKNISDDMLNPIVFTIATNDLAIRFQKYHDGKYTYVKDRGYAFEEKLDENTGNVFNKRLRDYQIPEATDSIPMMFITPTIVNDGRKLLISPQGCSFMTNFSVSPNLTFSPIPQEVEFTNLFHKQDADNLLFTSALRMNASFPYITPIVSLPSDPPIEVMDAGLLDNFGLEESIKFINTFQNWLEANTSRIIIVQIRDQYKKAKISNNAPKDIIQSFSFPVNQFYGTLFQIENYKEDMLTDYLGNWYKGKVDVICLQLNNEGNNDISLNWHLTDQEKKQVRTSVTSPENQAAIQKLKILLGK